MINSTTKLGENVTIKEGVIIGDNVTIDDDVYIDYGCIIRDNVHIKKGCFIGARSILGEYLLEFYKERNNKVHPLVIGENALIRTENVIYGDTFIGDNFQSGHKVTIRENSQIGNNVRIGTLSDIQGYCTIGNYVNLHSNVHIGNGSIIKDFVWIFPYVVLTNDPTPPSEVLKGVVVENFSVIATGSIILPGVHIEEDSLIGAGSVVNRDVGRESVVAGNPAKEICSIRKIKDKITGEQVYPWRYSFTRGMPWEKIGYEDWCKSLNIENQNLF